jgi:hypothetical protein
MKTIDILINKEGQLTINAVGFHGADCEKATAFLEAALGELQHRERKPEYRRQVRQQQKVGK